MDEDMEEYIVRPKKDLSLLTDEERLEHKKRQKHNINAKHYKKRKTREMYLIDTHNRINELLHDERCMEECSKEEKELFLECVKICKEELKRKPKKEIHNPYDNMILNYDYLTQF